MKDNFQLACWTHRGLFVASFLSIFTVLNYSLLYGSSKPRYDTNVFVKYSALYAFSLPYPTVKYCCFIRVIVSSASLYYWQNNSDAARFHGSLTYHCIMTAFRNLKQLVSSARFCPFSSQTIFSKRMLVYNNASGVKLVLIIMILFQQPLFAVHSQGCIFLKYGIL